MMIKFRRLKMYFSRLLFFLPFLFLLSCIPSQPHICIKDGQHYCVTEDWVPVISWDACYRRGLSCMEGGCWEYALHEFKQAISLRYKDRRNVRAYGMHFKDEYFPHREMGISYFRLGGLEDAIHELELSMSQTSSARAKYFLNQSRRSYFITTGSDTTPPDIRLEFSEEEHLTNQTPFQIKGTVRDDQGVAAISVNSNPVFIELAQPAIPFTSSVDLNEGWNTIEIIAKDLVDRQNNISIRVYLDQQGPLVIAHPLRENKPEGSNQITVKALIYDQSGIVSFQLNHREATRLGMDQLCLIEETVTLSPGVETIPFQTLDLAGNITKGEIRLLPTHERPNQPLKLACLDSSGFLSHPAGPLAQESHDPKPQNYKSKKEDIFFDIVYPPYEEVTTYYQEIFLEGEIEAKNGIQRIEINGEKLTDVNEIKAFEVQNQQAFIQKLIEQNLNPEKYIQTIKDIVQGYTTHYLNQKICLQKEFTSLTIVVEDRLGIRSSKEFRIRKIPQEEVVKSKQKMLLAIIPFDIDMVITYNRDRQDYIYKTLIEAFVCQGRFNLIEKDAIPWHLIKKACIAGKICDEDVVRQIGEITFTEGIICGGIQKWMDGLEIKAVFKEVENGETRLFHDVFTPGDTSRDLKAVISGLAMKFRDSFPICTGTIIGIDEQIIQVDIGSEKGLFPGMKYNIFMDELELIGKANIKKVEERSSEARVPKKKKCIEIKEGYRVRTR